jgi:hypothetical protein
MVSDEVTALARGNFTIVYTTLKRLKTLNIYDVFSKGAICARARVADFTHLIGQT